MPSDPVPIGATTGMKPPPSSAWITEGSIESISPTWPRSMWPFSFDGSSILRARMKAPSCPVRPTALPPAWLMSSTTSLLTWPPSTISTTSMVSLSVTRMPCTNSPFLPRRASSCSIWGPPPCTTTGFMPTSLSSTTSRAKPAFSSSSLMALPPNFTTMVLPWKRWIYGSASARMRAFSAACGLWLKGAFIPGDSTKQKGRRWAGPARLCCGEDLLDADLLARGCFFLRQRQLDHAVVVLGRGLRLVHFLRQREAARDLAERALGVEHALVRDFLLPLDISGQRDFRAVDGDLDVFLLDARDLGGDNVGAVFLGHVHLHAGQLRAPFQGDGTHQKALEQVIDQLVERIESGKVCHLLAPFLKLGTFHVGAAPPVS